MPASALTGTQKKLQRKSQKYLKELYRGEHGPETSLDKLMYDFKRAGKGAENIFAPIKEQAISEFQQTTAPELFGRFGRESGANSSALNQALAAARGNLQRQLASDFASLQTNIASSLLQQRESAKQNRMQSLIGISTPWSQVNPYLPHERGQNRAQGALGGAISGAIQGGITGGPWGALAGAGLGAGSGYAGADAGNLGEAGKVGGGYLQQKFGTLQS